VTCVLETSKGANDILTENRRFGNLIRREPSDETKGMKTFR
jgi:hypothetical protein